MAHIDEIFSKDELKTIEAITKALDKSAISMEKVFTAAKKLDETINKQNKARGTAANKQKQLTESEKEAARQNKLLAKSRANLNKELIKSQEGLKEQKKLTKAQIVLDDKRAGTEKKLLASNVKLRIERSKLIKTDKNYNAQLKRINTSLDKNNAAIEKSADKMKKQRLGVGRYTASIRKATMSIAGALGLTAGLAGLFIGLKKLIGLNSQLSDSLADVRKTTGLTTDEVQGLLKELKTIDTRTSIEGLLNIAVVAGRMNIASKDIKDFVVEVNQAVVALSDELGGDAEQIAQDLARISSVFGLEETFGAAEGINRIGSVINFLGANTKATSGDILNFTKRLQGISQIANISVNDISGMGAAFSELGGEVEVNATSISQLLILFGKKTKEFAKLAGVSTKEFSKILKEDANEALLLFATNTGKTTDGLESLAIKLDGLGLRGKRVVETISLLASNTDVFRKNQQLASDEIERATSLTDEYNIKNTNLAAQIEKLKKRFTNLFTSPGVQKFASFMVDGITRVIGSTKELADNVIKEQIAFNQLFGEIIKTTEKTDERRVAVENLQKIYPDFISNINLNTASEKLLRGELKLTNIEFQNRFIIQNATDAVNKRNETLAIARIALAKKEIEVRLKFANVAIKQGKIDEIATLSLTEQRKVLKGNFSVWNRFLILKTNVIIAENRLKTTQEENNEIIKIATANLRGNTEALKTNTETTEVNTTTTTTNVEAKERQVGAYAKVTTELSKNETALKDLFATQVEGGKVSQKEINRLESEILLLKSKIILVGILGKQKKEDKEDSDVVTFKEDSDEMINISNELADELGKQEKSIADDRIKETMRALKAEEDAAARRIELIKFIADASTDILIRFTEFKAISLQNEMIDLETQKAHELQLAGDNEEAREKIEDKFDKKSRELKSEQAINNKKQALFAAIINGIAATVKGYADGGIPLGLLMAGLSAIEVLAIESQSVPQFAKGVENFEGGKAEVSEKGVELGKTKQGQYFLTPAKRSIVDLPKGTDIIPHEQTMQILHSNLMTTNDNKIATDYAWKQVAKAINDKEFVNITGDPTGMAILQGKIKQRQDRRETYFA